MSVPRPGSIDLVATESFVEALRADPRPMTAIWGADDLILSVATAERLVSSIGRRIDHLVPGAAHGIQEDQGPVVGRLISDWLSGGP